LIASSTVMLSRIAKLLLSGLLRPCAGRRTRQRPANPYGIWLCPLDAIAPPAEPPGEKQHDEALPPWTRSPSTSPSARTHTADESLSVASSQGSSAVPALDQSRRLQEPNDLDELEVIRVSDRNDRSTRLFCCSCHCNLRRSSFRLHAEAAFSSCCSCARYACRTNSRRRSCAAASLMARSMRKLRR
jgi:hypothetical protein